MKKILYIILSFVAVFACTSKIEKDMPEEENTVEVTSVELSVSVLELEIGEAATLLARISPYNATDKTVTWTSSNVNVATVSSNGEIKAITPGDCNITAVCGNKSASCSLTVRGPFTYGGLCFQAINNGRISISNPNGLTIEYHRNQGEWISANSTIINLNVDADSQVWFRGNNASYNGVSVSCPIGDFYVYGNIMSLIYGDDYASKTELTEGNTFFKFFYNNSHIYNHPSLDIEFPATTLAVACYRNMFTGCKNLTRASKLPATILQEECYEGMYSLCSSLAIAAEMSATQMANLCCAAMYAGTAIEVAPELPVTNLAKGCYEFMFMECPNLVQGPAILPATQLANSCYTGMFQRCTKLTKAPVLPATEMAVKCYLCMFNGCISLENAPDLPSTSLATWCYGDMFKNTAIKVAPALPATEMEISCYQSMFEGCTNLEEAPVLPALVLEDGCYEAMFKGCSNLKKIKMLATKCIIGGWGGSKVGNITPGEITYYIKDWVNGVAANGTFVMNADATWNIVGVNGIPEGWTVIYEN